MLGTCRNVLLVDDEEPVVRLVQSVLSVLKCRTYPATSGDEALRIACELPALDLLITDLVMPEMDGFAVAERVVPKHPDAKVLLMSGYNPATEALRVVDNERIFFIAKPFAPSAFLRQVRHVLGIEGDVGRRAAG